MSRFFSYDLFSLYGALLNPFRNKEFGPELATLLLILALFVLLGFLFFTIPQSIRLRAALRAIKQRSQGERGTDKCIEFSKNYDEIDRLLTSNKTISTAWLEFRECLIQRDTSEPAIFFNSIPSNVFFNAKNFRVQYNFVRALPNFFVGLGLLGTFIGLIAALTFATQGLTNAHNQDDINNALKLLLTTAAAKFYISAAGLVSSLILSFAIRLTLKYLNGLIQQINGALSSCIQFLTSQIISETQLAVQRESLEELRVFNTNVALKIGDAVRSAIETGNQTVTTRLSAIAESFSKLLDSSKEGAGNAVNEAMKGALDKTLREASDAIGTVSGALQNIPERLSAAATSIEEAGNAARAQQEQLATTLQTALETMLNETAGKMTSSIATGTEGMLADLKQTGSSFGDSATKIEAVLQKFENTEEAYLERLSSLTDTNEKLETALENISNQVIAASGSVASANNILNENLDFVLSGIREFVTVAAETNRAVREFAGCCPADGCWTAESNVSTHSEIRRCR